MPLNNDDEQDDGDDDDNTEDDDDDIDDDLRKVKFWDCPLLITQDSPATPHLINFPSITNFPISSPTIRKQITIRGALFISMLHNYI